MAVAQRQHDARNVADAEKHMTEIEVLQVWTGQTYLRTQRRGGRDEVNEWQLPSPNSRQTLTTCGAEALQPKRFKRCKSFSLATCSKLVVTRLQIK